MDDTTPDRNDEYLGDGVYARFDGYMIWLDLRGQDNTPWFGRKRRSDTLTSDVMAAA